MEPTPDPCCRLYPLAEVRPSPLAGAGLFARASIAAGTVVARLGGRVVSDWELHGLFAAAALEPEHPYPEHPYIDSIALTETAHLVLPPRDQQSIGYSNHHCDPTLWWEGPFTLLARRDISADEELTSDYATSTWDPQFVLECACGPSADCRGTVTGNDWRLPELQARYGEHWVPALLSRIASPA
ncbi:SET domain-containing protein-lysine N-methyltransferase [Streptomyces sp. YIM 130001]|uniref:SET domain-containing protein n=1 Tax=Streptomyces sp. YIM 130001 TaxID=2259644 RepID=UPI0032048E8D